MSDELKRSLTDIADDVRYVDMYDRALGRSRQIRRNRITAAATSALAVLGLAGFGLVNLQSPERPGPAPVVAASDPLVRESVAPSIAPSVGSPASPSVSAGSASAPPARVTMATPRSRNLRDLPGRLFYRDPASGAVVRITGDGTRTDVLAAANDAVGVSPDGERIAYVAGGKLRLAGSEQPIYGGTVDPRKQFPVWSPDGRKLLIAAPEPGVLTVDGGAFGKLPGASKGQDFRWSGNGDKLVYSTADCRLKVADAGSGAGSTVPVLGDPDSARNPTQLSGCLPLSVNRTGSRVALSLSGGLRPLQPDTLVNTATGELVAMPVPGSVSATLFDTGGNLVVRAQDGARLALSVFDPNGRLLVQASEPASVKGLELIAYTR